jgi:hypothetical protein
MHDTRGLRAFRIGCSLAVRGNRVLLGTWLTTEQVHRTSPSPDVAIPPVVPTQAPPIRSGQQR